MDKKFSSFKLPTLLKIKIFVIDFDTGNLAKVKTKIPFFFCGEG